MTEWIITSSALILVIVLLRRILKGKISLRLQYALWALVLIRLLLPFSYFESSISLMNLVDNRHNTEFAAAADGAQHFEEIEYVTPVPQTPATATDIEDIYTSPYGTVQGYYPGDSDHMFPAEIMDSATVEEFQQLERTMKARELLITIWLTGTAVIALYFLITNLHFGKSLRRSRREKDIPGSIVPVYVSGTIPTPCLFGLFRPAVYLTPDCENDLGTMRHVLAHEFTHYRHGDNIWAILRCIALAIHWYNPLVWWAAVLSNRDAELACDEGAIKRLGEDERAPYGRTLIGMTCQRSDISALAHTATTMTGSGKSIKERITLIAKKPKMAVYTLVAVLIIAAVTVVCTFSASNSGFTDREALKDSRSLAESCAFSRAMEIEGKGEVSRFEGHILEQGEGLRQQYVSVKYALKDSPLHIVVDYSMLDEKGERYSEPFSVSTYISLSGTPIIEDKTSVDSVSIWKTGYNIPVPEEYYDELLDYMLQFEYGDYVRHLSELPDEANNVGFAVNFTDGGFLSFGINCIHDYHLARPELPQWLEEIFYGQDSLMLEFRDTGIKIKEELAEFDTSCLIASSNVLLEDIDYLEQAYSCSIEEAQLLNIIPISTGTAADTFSVNIYELEYRLRPDKPENIALDEGMSLSDGWLINGGFGKKYIVLLNTNVGTWQHLATLTDFDLESYKNEDAIELYGNEYTAACMVIYNDYMERLRKDIVFAPGVGENLPQHATDALRHEALWIKQDTERLCSGISHVEVAAVIPMELGTVNHDRTGNQMYHVKFRLKVSDPDSVVLVGGVQYSEGWFTEDRYMVWELYKGSFTTNFRKFRYLTIQETYSLPQYTEVYGNMFTAACAEAFMDAEYAPTPAALPIAMVGTAAPIGCYLHERSKRIWSWETESWLYADGFPIATVLNEPYVNQIPTETYSPDLNYYAGHGLRKALVVYDENMEPVYPELPDVYQDRTGTKAMRWLDPGTYYCVFSVNGKPGEYIPAAKECEYTIYDAVFRLEVKEDMFSPAEAFDPESIGDVSEIHYFGSDNCQLLFYEPENITAICSALSTATELGYVGDCFFDDALYLVGENSTVALCLAGDSCPSIYSDGKCWILSDEGMELIRSIITTKKSDMGYEVPLYGQFRGVLDEYATERLPKKLLGNLLGGIVEFVDYELIRYEVEHMSLKGDRFQGRIEFALKPDNPSLASHYVTGCYRMGEGKYENWVIGNCCYLFEEYSKDIWMMTSQTTGSLEWGEYPVSLSDDEAISQMVKAMEGNDEKAFLQLLPVCNPRLIPKGEENSDIMLDFYDSILDYAIGEDQTTRNLYIMKGSLLGDGALGEQYSIALRMLYQHDPESYTAALSYLDEEERENVEMAREYANSYYE